MPPKFVLALTPQHRDTSSAKVSLGYTPNSEVISANLLHFKPTFDPPLKKVVRGAAVPGGGMLVRFGHSLWAEIWSSEKYAFGGYNSTSRSPRLLDQTSSDLFRLTREKSQ